ncbi:hypothetical protein [Deinococcus sp. RM]|uniref:hypothetical protein n=1 Tax=Deinococcus sp. RM TaxID=2316359 RepID=UPI003AB2FBB9
MSPRPSVRLARVAALGALLGPAGAVTLSVRDAPLLPGPPALTEARWDAAGGAHLCLGERLVHLGAADLSSAASTWLGAPCRAVSVTPDATLAAALVGDRVVLMNVAQRRVTGTLTVTGLSGAGFGSGGELLVGSGAGLERVNPADLSRQVLDPAPVAALTVAADGSRALVVRGSRAQLLDTRTLRVLSGTSCDDTCAPGRAVFSADGRSVTVPLGRTLVALRDGLPATTVLRASDPETAGAYSGLPLRNNTVLILRDGETQVRDVQTGHRERRVGLSGLGATPASLSPREEVLSVGGGAGGAALSAGTPDQPTARTLLRLPGAVRGGAVLADGSVVTVGRDDTLRAGPRAAPALDVQGVGRFTFALTGSGAAELRGGTLVPLAGQRGATALSVNHWGNHVASWTAQGLSVTAQKTGRVIFSAPVAGLSRVTVSPDATRAYLFPARGEARVMLLANRKTFALPVTPGAAYRDVQISGKGVFAYLRADGRTDLYAPGQRQPLATLPGGAPARFSPDSSLLAAATPTPSGWVVALHDPASGRELTRSVPLDGAPAFVAWGADSRTLLVGAGPLSGLGSVLTFTVTP